jgi:hypothetical protein
VIVSYVRHLGELYWHCYGRLLLAALALLALVFFLFSRR